jgi:hypothetical protein
MVMTASMSNKAWAHRPSSRLLQPAGTLAGMNVVPGDGETARHHFAHGTKPDKADLHHLCLSL